jgi:prolycopene isomerase
LSQAPHVVFGREYPRRYDAIVIGSGIGGLVCANLLAKGGMRVLLLEKHSVLGGFCCGFRRKGFLFDAATHFYPLLGNPTTLTGKLLKEIECETEWVKMDPVDQFHFPGMDTFSVPAGFPEYIEKLKSWFPEEAAGVDAYFAELRQSYLYGLLYYFKGVSNDYVERYEKVTMTEKLDEHFRDPRIKGVLMGDTPHWGSLPNRTSYIFDAMLRLSYFLGNYFPKGGSQQFADDLGRALVRKGGKIIKCAGVERIRIENGKAVGVRVFTNGKRAVEHFDFDAPMIVSNADALHTYRDLIGDEHCSRWIVERLEGMTPSYPCFLMHFGLKDMDPEALAKTEGYYWTSYDPGDAIRNVFKVFIPTHFDPKIAPEGCQIVIIQKLTPLRIEDIKDWPAHKADVEGQIMSRLRDIIPGIDDHTVVRLGASAMTSYRFTGNHQGAMLGWEMSPDQLGPGRLPFYTPVENIHLVGHWTQPGGGITPVIVSAQRVARAILTGRDEGRDLAAKYFAFRAQARAEIEVPTQLKEGPRQ